MRIRCLVRLHAAAGGHQHGPQSGVGAVGSFPGKGCVGQDSRAHFPVGTVPSVPTVWIFTGPLGRRRHVDLRRIQSEPSKLFLVLRLKFRQAHACGRHDGSLFRSACWPFPGVDRYRLPLNIEPKESFLGPLAVYSTHTQPFGPQVYCISTLRSDPGARMSRMG